jgi:hypothetical protein
LNSRRTTKAEKPSISKTKGKVKKNKKDAKH